MRYKNRIMNILKSTTKTAKCVVVNDFINDKVIVSLGGDKYIWEWTGLGLRCPVLAEELNISPLAAETLVDEEIQSLLQYKDIEPDEVIYISPGGEKMSGVYLTPSPLDKNALDVIEKKTSIKKAYSAYTASGDRLSEEIILEAIVDGVLSHLLTIVNV